jgi:hypothetical protein
MVFIPTEFHTPSFNCSLVATIKMTGKENVFTATKLLNYILQKYYLRNSAYSSKIYYHTLFQNPNVSGVHIAPASQVYVFAMLLLLTVGNQKFGFRVSSNGMTSKPSFVKIGQTVQKLK